MTKRKSSSCDGISRSLPLNSLDAALDLLVCETFHRVEAIASKFEAYAGVKLNDGVTRARWDEAVKRYWVMKSMDDLCCSANKLHAGKDGINGSNGNGEVEMGDNEVVNGMLDRTRRDSGGRLLPANCHPGAIAIHTLNPEEELEWRKWSPKVGDVVLAETSNGELWPGKIIDKKTFFQGRTTPRGNHFFPIRVYSEDIEPSITVKSRLVPLYLRPNPPLLASAALQSAYHHAMSPTTFDMQASSRESLAAHNRAHPGVGEGPEREKAKAEKEAWNKQVNWVMNERRVEKMRTMSEERERRLREVAKSNNEMELTSNEWPCQKATGREPIEDDDDDCVQKKRRTHWLEPDDVRGGQGGNATDTISSIFGPVISTTTPTANGFITPTRTASPSLASFIRPALSTPQRPSSPRRLSRDKRRSGIYSGIGEHSPRGQRGGTYTPPRILPSGDETAPHSQRGGGGSSGTGSPAPTLPKFEFVSPLGPRSAIAKLTQSSSSSSINELQTPTMLGGVGRRISLEVVKEENESEEGGEWTVVRRKQRRASEPLGEKAEMAEFLPNLVRDGDGEAMEL